MHVGAFLRRDGLDALEPSSPGLINHVHRKGGSGAEYRRRTRLGDGHVKTAALPLQRRDAILEFASKKRELRLERFERPTRVSTQFSIRLDQGKLDAFEATQGLFALRGRFIAMCRRLVAVRLDVDGDDFKDMQ